MQGGNRTDLAHATRSLGISVLHKSDGGSPATEA